MRGGRSRCTRSSTGTHLQRRRRWRGWGWGTAQGRCRPGPRAGQARWLVQPAPAPTSDHTLASPPPSPCRLPAGELGAVGGDVTVAAAVRRAPARVLAPRVRRALQAQRKHFQVAGAGDVEAQEALEVGHLQGGEGLVVVHVEPAGGRRQGGGGGGGGGGVVCWGWERGRGRQRCAALRCGGQASLHGPAAAAAAAADTARPPPLPFPLSPVD